MKQITRRSCMAVGALGAAVMVVGQAQAAVAGSDPQSLAGLARAKGLTGFDLTGSFCTKRNVRNRLGREFCHAEEEV
jgi:hypothetical protein